MRKSGELLFGAACGLLAGAMPTSASVISTPVRDAYVLHALTSYNFGPQHYDSCGTSDGHGGTAYFCHFDENITYDGNGDMTVSLSHHEIVPGHEAGFGVEAEGLYFFRVNGPASPKKVKLTINASALTSSQADSFVHAFLSVAGASLTESGPGTNLLLAEAQSCDMGSILAGSYCGGPSHPSSFSGPLSFWAPLNTELAVDMDVRIFSLTSASATIDPMITFDPDWAANNPGYSLAFSTNIGGLTANPIPEPVSLSLFGAGLGGLAFLRRKRKKSACNYGHKQIS